MRPSLPMTQRRVWRRPTDRSIDAAPPDLSGIYLSDHMDQTAASLMAEVPDLPDHESRRLLLAAAEAEASWLLSDPPAPSAVVDRFRQFVERRRRGEPIQYIEGSVQFGPLVLTSDSRALVPRPESEGLWEIAVGLVRGRHDLVIVDLCTGSGNLALACKYVFRDARVIGTDVSASALSLATENAAATGLDIELRQGDLLAAVPTELRGRVDLIVSNPPYVASTEIATLPADVREFEPRQALVSGRTGTEVLSRIATAARQWLRPGGFIACEIGETQGAECLDLFSGYNPKIELDLAGRTRYVVGCAPECHHVH